MIEIRPMAQGEEREACELVLRVFHACVAPAFAKSGIRTFLSAVSPETLDRLRAGDDSFVLVAEAGEEIVGLLAVRDSTHIALFFVDGRRQGQGIGTRLFEAAVARCRLANPAVSAVTVNAAPNSLTFYQAAGFAAQDVEREENGMRFTPMSKAL